MVTMNINGEVEMMDLTDERIESIARKAHWLHICHLSPAILKDPEQDKYWEVLTEEFKEPWRQVVRLVAEELTSDLLPRT